jgi:hypothetical protein
MKAGSEFEPATTSIISPCSTQRTCRTPASCHEAQSWVNPNPTISAAANDLATTSPWGRWMRLLMSARRSILFQSSDYSAVTIPSITILATCYAAHHQILKFRSAPPRNRARVSPPSVGMVPPAGGSAAVVWEFASVSMRCSQSAWRDISGFTLRGAGGSLSSRALASANGSSPGKGGCPVSIW